MFSKWRLGAALVVTVWSLLVGPTSLAQAEEADTFPITFLTDGPYALQLEGAWLEAHIPIERNRAVGDNLDNPQIEQFAVHARYAGLEEHQLIVKSETVPGDPQGTPLSLVISIDVRSLAKRHGDYTIGLRARIKGKTKDGAKDVFTEWQDQAIILRRIKATLAAPAAITVAQQRIGFIEVSNSSDHFRVTTSRGAAPQVQVIGRARVEGVEVGGQVRIVDDPAAQGPLQWAHVATIQEDFPTGDSIGVIRVDSPDADAVDVPLTVKTSQHWFVIVLLAGIGILAGFWVRVELTLRIQRSRSLLQLSAVEREIVRLLGRIHWSEFTETARAKLRELATLADALRAAGKAEAIAKIAEDIPKIKQALDAAVAKADTKRAALVTAMKTASDAIGDLWVLPTSLEAPVQSAREALQTVAARLAAFELDQAQLGLGLALLKPTKDIAKAWDEWRNQMDLVRRELPQTKPVFPKSTQDELDKKLPELLVALAAVRTAASGKPADEQLAAYADGADKARQLAKSLLQALVNSVAARAGAVMEAVENPKPALPVTDVTAIHAARTTLLAASNNDALNEALNEPKSGLLALREALAEVNQSMEAIVRVQFEKPELDVSIQELLSEGRYEDAVTAARKILRAKAKPEARRAIRRARTTVDEEQWSVTASQRGQVLTAYATGQAPGVRDFIVDPVETRRALMKAAFWQAVLVGVLFLFVAVVLFEKTYVGYLAQNLQIAFWGFAVDISANSLLEGIKKIPAK